MVDKLKVFKWPVVFMVIIGFVLVGYAIMPKSYTQVTIDNVPPGLTMINPAGSGYYSRFTGSDTGGVEGFIVKFEMMDENFGELESDGTITYWPDPQSMVTRFLVDGSIVTVDIIDSFYHSSSSTGDNTDPAALSYGFRVFSVALDLTMGQHTVDIEVQDPAGNTDSYYGEFTVWAGTVEGIVRIDSVEPYDGMFLRDVVDITFEVTTGLSGIDGVGLVIDGGIVGGSGVLDPAIFEGTMTFDGNDTYYQSLDTRTLTDGSHVIEIVIVDVQANYYTYSVFSGDFDNGNVSPVRTGMEDILLIGIGLVVAGVAVFIVITMKKGKTQYTFRG